MLAKKYFDTDKIKGSAFYWPALFPKGSISVV